MGFNSALKGLMMEGEEQQQHLTMHITTQETAEQRPVRNKVS
jgi:hypothetical protein